METRKLKEEEYQAALQLALDVFMQFEAPIYPEEGIQDFTHFIKEVAPGMAIDYYGAFEEGVLVGMMAMREPRHLTLVFIRDDYQRMVIGTSAMIETELDCIVNQYTEKFCNPMVMWGKYRKGWLKTTLPVSFQFHHVQMDGGHGASFLESLQKTISSGIYKNR